MSTELEETAAAAASMCCASCGKAEVDDVKLKKCACKLVQYCSVACQKNHRHHHKKACKKRMAEIRDDRLFKQPDESYLGECEICCLPLPLDKSKCKTNSCCCKRICVGCCFTSASFDRELGQQPKCPYCREQLLEKTWEERNQNFMKRAKVNNPIALSFVGRVCKDEGDYKEALEYLTKAAELGDVAAHYELARLYHFGHGIMKNEKKEVCHLEEAAIGGHPEARRCLGCHEEKNGRPTRAMRHYIIAAKLGYDKALKNVKLCFQKGALSKEDFEAALRGHQAAVDETKSKQREEAYTAMAYTTE